MRGIAHLLVQYLTVRARRCPCPRSGGVGEEWEVEPEGPAGNTKGSPPSLSGGKCGKSYDDQFEECIQFCKHHKLKGGAVITACQRQQPEEPVSLVFGKWGLLYNTRKTMPVRTSPEAL